MTDTETEQYHLAKLYDLSLKSVGENPQLEEPTDEQKEWALFRLSHDETWPNIQETKKRGDDRTK